MSHNKNAYRLQKRNKLTQADVCPCVSKLAETQTLEETCGDVVCAALERDVAMRSRGIKTNPIHTEFLYYSAMLKEIAPRLSSERDRQRIIPWIKKMFRPEYHSSVLREKRNKYLLFMTLSLLNDETYSVLRKVPPSGAVPDLSSLPEDSVESAEWETDTTWQDIVDDLPDERKRMPCAIHMDNKECNNDHQLDNILDEEFAYLLYLLQPYVYLLKIQDDKDKINAWIETLCRIQGYSCSTMRGIRNDYMMVLLGYMHELRVTGPFAEYPKDKPLPPLSETAKLSTSRYPSLDPASNDVNDLLQDMPMPQEGAFCYLAVTGDIVYEDVSKKGGGDARTIQYLE